MPALFYDERGTCLCIEINKAFVFKGVAQNYIEQLDQFVAN